MVKSSPAKLVDVEAAKLGFASILPGLRELRRRLPLLSDSDLALEIERKFGDQIAFEICPKLGTTLGECLLMAVALANGGETVEIGRPSVTGGI